MVSAAEAPRPEHVDPVALSRIGEQLGAPVHGSDVTVTGVSLDSRSVVDGDLWCALPGANTHGACFAAGAAERGAVAALTDAAGAEDCRRAGLAVIEVADPRAETARAAALVYGLPARGLTTLGVTGTNGKTSVTTMIDGTLRELGRTSGLIGTGGTSFRDRDGRDHRVGTVRTTPEAPEMQGILARMVEHGVETCSLEVSSHALVLHRADEIVLDVACFTNLTQDHLDFHGDMETYFAAKATLLTPEHSRRGVVCVDDDWGRRLARQATVPVTTYATLPGIDADHRAEDITSDGFGTDFRLVDRDGASRTLHSALPGRHYVANTIAVQLMLEAAGLDPDSIAPALAHAGTVPGRMEQIDGHPVHGVVDFSHTEDSLVQALTTLRAIPGTGRLITVMGAGGDRDRAKRPLMGAAAARLSDVVVVTDDNPRSEDPAAIRAQVLAGIPAAAPAQIHECDGREAAIRLAVELAAPGDTVLVAGKGAETGQDIGGVVHPFDDRIVLRDALAAGAEDHGTEGS